MRRSLTKYTQTGPLSGGVSYASRDMRPERQVSITIEPGESNALAQLTEFVYDSNSDPEYFAALNQTQVRTYHYKVISLSTAQNSDIDTIAALFSSSDLATIKETDYIYDSNYKTRNITSLVSETRLKDAGGNVKAKTQITYDESSYWLSSSGSMPSAASGSWVDPQSNYRGLATTAKGYYDISGNGFTTTHSFYDQYGNVRKIRDGEGHDTEAQYSADFAFAYQTSTITPVPDSTGVKGSNTAFTSTSDYDYQTGLVLSTVDPNGIENLFEYDDPLLRLTEVSMQIESNQTPVGAITQTIYGAGTSASTRFVKVRSQIDENNWQESYSWYDGLGRTIKTQSVNSDGDIFVETEYDDLSRVKKVSNPYRSGETVYWTEKTYDDLGRAITVETLGDNSEVNTAFSLATSGDEIGTVVTVTDQAGKVRRSITNALGQLIRVDEPNASNQLGTISSPNQDTLYSYDTFSNLVSVDQGVQTRTFTYDALSRLTEATNPESGTISYSYDDNSNLVSKTDARNITTSYEYDSLNRITKREYSDTVTPTVDYYYDNLTNAKGKLIKVANSNSTTEYTEFDPLGRITKSKQMTDGTAFPVMEYSYNLSGVLIEETYPSGRKVKNILDNDGELSMVSSRKDVSSGYWNYASSFKYSAAGAVTRMQLGNGTWESTTFNSRLQPEQIAVGTTPAATNLLKLDYTYESISGSDNNGNVLTQKITVPDVGSYQGFVAEQSYTYDPLNRLASAEEKIDETSSWKQAFSYDRYGNRNFNENPANTSTLTWGCGNPTGTEICDSDRMRENPEIDTTTNRIKTNQPGGQSNDYGYDMAGNVTLDPDGNQFSYDGENKQIKVLDSESSLKSEYWYDGDGRRVRKHVPSTGEVTVFIYDAGGKVVAEFSTIVASPTNAKVNYLTHDNLGSPRILTGKNGSVNSRRDFMPFGEEITSDVTSERSVNLNYPLGLNDGVRQKFTGYQRDNETELDFAQTRYFAYSLGRFSGPDSFLKGPSKGTPASWNLYVYTENNPMKFVDPKGQTIYVYIGGIYQNGKLIYRDGELYHLNGDKYEGDDEFARAVQRDLNGIRAANEYAAGVIDALVTSDLDHYVSNADKGNSSDPTGRPCLAPERCGSLISYNPFNHMIGPERSKNRGGGRDIGPAFINLAHEVWHSYQVDIGKRLPNSKRIDTSKGNPEMLDPPENELYAVQFENLVREGVGLKLRESYYSPPDRMDPSFLQPGYGNHITEKFPIRREKAVTLTPTDNR
ncbi:MAG: hypothetical protein J5I65_01090 [Aridibacter famidurans]|nr:hypothetical protein [Aridibacter famidurans]